MKNYIIIENPELLEEKLTEKKGVIILLGHFGNWEAMSFLCKIKKWDAVTVGKTFKPKILANFYFNLREKSGIKIFLHKNSIIHLYKALKKNKIIALLIDQRTRKPGSVKINFAGEKVYATAAPAFLYKKLKSPVLFAYSERTNNHHKITFYELKLNNNIEESTQIIQDIIKDFIINNPYNYFWLHSKFKSRRRVIENI